MSCTTPPGYLWAITIAGITAIAAATCAVLYGGAVRAVPLLFALHITSVSALARARRTPLPATAPLAATAK